MPQPITFSKAAPAESLRAEPPAIRDFVAHYAVGHVSGPGGEEHVLISHDKPPSFPMVTSLATTAPMVPTPFGVRRLSLGIHEDFTTV